MMPERTSLTRRLTSMALALFALGACAGKTAKEAHTPAADGGLANAAAPAPPSCTVPPDTASRPRGKAIAIFYTANVVGEIEPCG